MLTNDYYNLLWYAFKYALGRRTYAVRDVANIILKAWDFLPPDSQYRFKLEINHAIERNEAGSDIDVKVWQTILELPIDRGIYNDGRNDQEYP